MSKQILPPLALALLFSCAEAPEPRMDVEPTAPVPPPLELQGSAYDAAATVELPKVAPGEYPGLHNVYRLSDTIISGGEPHGSEALEQISEWGVKTIISVDGKVPDAATAEKLGMRYVHIPIQYSGIDEEEVLQIAKSFRELEGPFYVHCFHGKHRGPAAAAVGRVVLDGVPRIEAIAEMRQWCATSSKYEGLYATVAVTDFPSTAETAAYDFDFPSAHAFEGMRAVMVQLTRSWDNVAALEKRDFTVDPEHPDVDPLQEATQVHQLFEAFADLGATNTWRDDFRAWLEEGRTGAEELVSALSSRNAPGADPLDLTWRTAAEAAFDRVEKSCSQCHKAYRD